MQCPRKPILLGIASVAAVIMCLTPRVPPELFVYNTSASAPVGFYRRIDAEPHAASFVTVRALDVAPLYAQARNFADDDDRFIKRVAAQQGEFVCAAQDRVRVGEMWFARQFRDSAGRLLPAWTGCRRLEVDEYFLLGESADSFDSRYFGPVSRGDIEAVWRKHD